MGEVPLSSNLLCPNYPPPSVKLTNNLKDDPPARRTRMEYRGTSLIINRHPIGQYSRTTPRLIRWS